MKNNDDSTIPSESIVYAFARCEALIDTIAENINESKQELREWVGILLLSEGTGIINNLSSLRSKTSNVHKTVRKMEMDERSYSKTSRSKDKRIIKGIKRKGVKKGFSYNGKHWTQQSKNRKKLLAVSKARHAAYNARVNGEAK